MIEVWIEEMDTEVAGLPGPHDEGEEMRPMMTHHNLMIMEIAKTQFTNMMEVETKLRL